MQIDNLGCKDSLTPLETGMQEKISMQKRRGNSCTLSFTCTKVYIYYIIKIDITINFIE